MKNFFKKLSFVLALAMIVTAIAPAAGAFAASAPALSAKGTKYLYLGNATKSSLDLNVTNKPTGASYVWSSSKKTIATVDKYGVVKGVKQGKTTVSLAITKKDGSKTTLSVDFVVRNNIKSFTSIVDADGADLAKLVAGKAYDLNGKFTTNGGSTTSTSSVARWSVDSDKATIDVKTGVFTATEAGTYKVTVNAFETATGADAWVALNDKTSTAGVKATGTFDVTVITSLVSSRQVDQDTLELTFDSDMSKSTLEKDLVLYQIVGSTPISTGAEKIKKVSFDTTGKIVTIDVYANLSAGGSYKLVAGEFVTTFTAATAKLTDITKIVFDDVKVKTSDNAGVDLLDYVKALNADGVVIFTGKDLKPYLTFTYGGEAGKGFVSGTILYLYGEGTSAKVTATFSNWVVGTNGSYTEFKVTDDAAAIVYKEDTNLNNASLTYLLNNGAGVDDKTTGWSSNFVVPKGDSNLTIQTKYQLNNAAAGKYEYDNTKFTFTANDPSKVLITGNKLTALNEGSVDVVVKTAADGKVVGVFTVVVGAARALASFESDVYTATLGNISVASGLEETKTFKLSVKDTQGVLLGAETTLKAEFTSKPSGSVITDAVLAQSATNADGVLSWVVNGSVFDKDGTYNVKLTATAKGATRSIGVTINVLDSTSKVVVRYIPTLTSTEVDLKNINADTTVDAVVYGYNAAGARVEKLSTADYTTTVTKSTGVAQTTGVTANSYAVATLSGTAFTTNFASETYRVEFKAAKDIKNTALVTIFADKAVMGSAILTVKDSADVKATVDKRAVTYSAGSLDTVKAVANAALKLTIDGVELTASQILTINDASYAATIGSGSADGTAVLKKGDSVYIKTITYTLAPTGTGKTRTVTFVVNELITLN